LSPACGFSGENLTVANQGFDLPFGFCKQSAILIGDDPS
jgi:hypothetical protein